jgi:hypothetical protein
MSSKEDSPDIVLSHYQVKPPRRRSNVSKNNGIIDDSDSFFDKIMNIPLSNAFINITKFTDKIIHELNIDNIGKIVYLCKANPFKIKSIEGIQGDSYNVSPVCLFYRSGNDNPKKLKEEFDFFKEHQLLNFTIRTTNIRKLTEKGIKDGFAIVVDLTEKAFEKNKYYDYNILDELPEEMKKLLEKYS